MSCIGDFMYLSRIILFTFTLASIFYFANCSEEKGTKDGSSTEDKVDLTCDLNGDGKVVELELGKCSEGVDDPCDKDKDGKLSASEKANCDLSCDLNQDGKVNQIEKKKCNSALSDCDSDKDGNVTSTESKNCKMGCDLNGNGKVEEIEQKKCDNGVVECDLDGDGKATESETQKCEAGDLQCDLNGDGKVDEVEQIRCDNKVFDRVDDGKSDDKKDDGDGNAQTNSNSSSSKKPINFATMLHLEGGITKMVDTKEGFDNYSAVVKAMIDLFYENEAKLTVESELPYVEAVDQFGNNLLRYALSKNQGVGTHCDISPTTSDYETLKSEYKKRKDKLDTMVGAENNFGCSGGWSLADWAKAADEAGFAYLNGPVVLALQPIPEAKRPINPETGKPFTDDETKFGSDYFHDPIPPDVTQRFYPRRLKDTNDFEEDETGIVLLTGSLGELSKVADGYGCTGKCTVDQKDIDVIIKQIKEFYESKDESKVNLMYLHAPFSTYSNKDSRTGLTSWLEQMKELQDQGIIKWKTMKEVYEEYIAD